MGYSAFDVIPATFSDFFIAKMLKDVALDTENYIWNAATGIQALLVADGSAAVPAPVAITAANVIDKLGALVDLIPASLYGQEDLRIYVSQNVAKAYVRALGGFGATGLGSNGVDNKGTSWFTNGALTFDGIQIFVANGLPASNMVATTISNIYFGTGLADDSNEVKVLDMADIDGSKNVRFVARFTRGIQIGFGGDSATYTV